MADAGGERAEKTRRRARARGRVSSSAPRFINRIPGRVFPLHLELVGPATRRTSHRWSVRGEKGPLARGARTSLDSKASRLHPSTGAEVTSREFPSKEKGERMKRPIVR